MADHHVVAANTTPTHYPVGQRARSHHGPGIFTDHDGERILVWVDVALTGRVKLIQKLVAEGAEIATQHWDPYVHLLILSPATVRIFDMYCHPDYMRPVQYARYQQRRQRRMNQRKQVAEEAWTSKVMLKESWANKCFAAGRFLGEADNWAGLRAGGPVHPINPIPSPVVDPTNHVMVVPVKEVESIIPETITVDPPEEVTFDPPEIQVIPATQRTPSPISVVEDQVMDDDGSDVIVYSPGPGVENATDDVPPSTSVVNTTSQPISTEDRLDTGSQPVPSPQADIRVEDGDVPLVSSQRAVAIADPLPSEGDDTGGGSQAMELDPPSSQPALAGTNSPTTNEDADMPVQADDDGEGSTPRAGPSSPVTLMRERDGELEVVPGEDSEEEIETVETPRQPYHSMNDSTDASSPEKVVSGSAQSQETLMEVEEEDEVDRNMTMEVDQDNHNAMGQATEQRHLPDSPVNEPVEPSASQSAEQFSSQMPLEPEGLENDPLGEDTNAEAGPSTPRFQSPQKVDDPTKLFEGYRFWVDLKRPDRTDLIKRIRAAGGHLVMTYDQATHVLVHDHRLPMWQSIISTVVRRGVWFMDFKWVVMCLNDGIQYPELGHHLPGGAPSLLTHISPPSHRRRKRERGSESGSQTTPTTRRMKESPSSLPRDVPVADGPAPHDADEIARLFQLAQIELSGNIPQIVKRLQQSMPGKGYSDAKWAGLYDRWRWRTGRFSHIPHVQPTTDEMLPLLKDLSIRAEAGKLSDRKALHELHDAFPFAFPSHEDWNTIWTEYQRKTGVFAADLDRNSQVPPVTALAGSQSRAYHSSPPATSTTSSDPGKTATVKRGTSWLSPEEMSAIFEREYPKYAPARQAIGKLAESLCETYGKYSLGTWQQYLTQWRGGTGRFEGFGSREPLPSVRNLTDEDVGRIFTSYLPTWEKHRSASSLGAEIAKEYDQYAAGTWGVYFGDWRRGKNRFAPYGKEYMNPNRTAASPGTSDSQPSSSSKLLETVKEEPIQSSPPAPMSSETPGSGLHRQPYTELDLERMGQYIVDRLPQRTSFSPQAWFDFADKYPGRTPNAWSQKYYNNRRSIYRHARALATEQNKLQEYETVYDDENTTAGHKALNPLTATAQSTGRTGQPYSDEELNMMAKYVVDRLPAKTRGKMADWTQFAVEHPERSVAAWVQKWTSGSVDRLVRDLSVERGKLAQFDKAFPLLARVLAPSEPAEIIEIDSDSDDPDFVDMTGMDSD